MTRDADVVEGYARASERANANANANALKESDRDARARGDDVDEQAGWRTTRRRGGHHRSI